MDREYFLDVLIAVIGGTAILGSGWWPAWSSSQAASRDWERLAWRRIWLPLVPAAIAVAWLFGWALVEPDPAENVPAPLLLAALPFGAFFARAAVRAMRSLIRRLPDHGAMTVGLFRPRIVFSPALAGVLDSRALQAALEHEQAHRRHRDPLRLWLAQFATDLQWPWPQAGERFRIWMRALELARDEEARARGVDGPDLAAAVVASSRLYQHATSSVGSALTGDASALKERVARLLEPVPVTVEKTYIPWLIPALLVPGLVLAAALGSIFGESVVRALLWIAA